MSGDKGMRKYLSPFLGILGWATKVTFWALNDEDQNKPMFCFSPAHI